MNKKLFLVLLLLALGLIAYNSTLVDFEDPFAGDSTVAVIGIVASLCAIVLLFIFKTSKSIEKKVRDRD